MLVTPCFQYMRKSTCCGQQKMWVILKTEFTVVFYFSNPLYIHWKIVKGLLHANPALFQVMAGCHQAPSHYPNQSWPQWVNLYNLLYIPCLPHRVTTIQIMLKRPVSRQKRWNGCKHYSMARSSSSAEKYPERVLRSSSGRQGLYWWLRAKLQLPLC